MPQTSRHSGGLRRCGRRWTPGHHRSDLVRPANSPRPHLHPPRVPNSPGLPLSDLSPPVPRSPPSPTVATTSLHGSTPAGIRLPPGDPPFLWPTHTLSPSLSSPLFPTPSFSPSARFPPTQPPPAHAHGRCDGGISSRSESLRARCHVVGGHALHSCPRWPLPNFCLGCSKPSSTGSSCSSNASTRQTSEGSDVLACFGPT